MWQLVTQSFRSATTRLVAGELCRFSPVSITTRCASNYDPYPSYETPSPYKERKGSRRVNNPKVFDGGLLPRPTGDWEKKLQPIPDWMPEKKDQWTKKKALFGQNDYIDILGDGTIHPWELIVAPMWLKGYRGNELQNVSRQLGAMGTYMKETNPSRYHQLTKILFYQYKRMNRRHHAGFWGGGRGKNRIDKPLVGR